MSARLPTHTQVTRCAHCGLDVPAALQRAGARTQFCCGGCEQVYALLHACKLDAYYTLRDNQGQRGQPARVSGRDFADFDDPVQLQELSQVLDGGLRRVTLYLEGLHCAACLWLIERLPQTLPGRVDVRLSLASSLAVVDWDPQEIALSKIARSLDRLGYTPHLHRRGETTRLRQQEDRSLLIRLGVASVCAMNIMLISGALYAGEYQGMASSFWTFFRGLSLALSVPVLSYAAQPFFRTAWAGLRQRVPHMDLPIALALLTAFAYSATNTLRGEGPIYFDSLAALVALLLGARYLQQRAQRAAVARSESLRGVAFVEFARRLDAQGLVTEVPLAALRPGDRVEVRSGDLLPVDGVIVEGNSHVDSAVLTGEPEPQAVGMGDRVFAGCGNQGGRLTVEVEACGERSRVGALLKLVDEASHQRAPIVALADRISRVFVAVVLALAALAAALAYARSHGELGAAIQQMVALLVVTCPCALGLATPVAMSVGLARAARAGLFVKNAAAIERLPHIDTVLLDKTGTLTLGRSELRSFVGDDPTLWLAQALESQSSHPVARALLRHRAEQPRPVFKVSEVHEQVGRGIHGEVAGQQVRVGSPRWLREAELSINATWQTRIDDLLARNQSPVLVAVDGELRGLAGLGDALRADAAELIAELQGRGVHIHILSGDDPTIVRRVGGELGLSPEHCHGGLSPEDKLKLVRSHVERSRAVMMVGDGVNDAAALAQAQVGVAVAGSSGASVIAADVVLTRPGLAPVVELMRGSRRLMGVVRRNLGFSLLYNMAGASLALLGLVGPLLAAVLMPLSSLTVIGASLLGRSFVVFVPSGTTRGRA